MARRKGKEYTFYFKNGKTKTIKGVFLDRVPGKFANRQSRKNLLFEQ